MRLNRTESILICCCAGIIAILAVMLWLPNYLREKISKRTHNFLNSIDMALPRGYRNNNPGNIRISREDWQGEIRPSQDSEFKQFKSMGYGFRAMLKLLRNYIRLHECNTIEKIISRWAPKNENNTSAYINHVSQRTGIPADQPISQNDREKLIDIAYAIAYHENGSAPDRSDIEAGWEML